MRVRTTLLGVSWWVVVAAGGGDICRAPAATTTHQDTPSSVVRTLTAQLTALKQQHRDDVHQLRQALETAHGEILELRRRLGHHRDTVPQSPSKDGYPS